MMPTILEKLFDTSHLIGALVLGGVILLAGIVLSRIIRRLLREALQYDKSQHIDAITLKFLSRLVILVMWLVLGTFYAHLVPALNRLGTALLTGVSLVSIIVGFAAQSTLSNLVAGISLVLYKPFKLGDRLQIAAPRTGGFEVGTVEDISLGFTRLRTDDGRDIVVANGTMAQQTMIKLAPPTHEAQVRTDPPSP